MRLHDSGRVRRVRSERASSLAVERGASARHVAGDTGPGARLGAPVDEADVVWVMLHSGSRGVGNRIGTYFIERAREEMLRLDRSLPDRDLAYFEEGTESFADYVEAVSWAQRFASTNRALMMEGGARKRFGPGVLSIERVTASMQPVLRRAASSRHSAG